MCALPGRSTSGPDNEATSTDVDVVMARFRSRIRFTQAVTWELSSPYDQYVSLCRAVRDQIVDRMIATQAAYQEQQAKRVCYLSLEYLLGRFLKNNLVCLGLYDGVRERLARLGVELDRLCEFEPDAGLGNGGLGRLAACYLDSATTLELPMYGYGIRYDFGIFEQAIVNGWQVERPDCWLRFGSPWEVARPELTCPVRLYGRVNYRADSSGRFHPIWQDYRTVMAVPYDLPIVAYGTRTVNFLRLWAARASESFDLAAFNRGGFVEAVREQALTETLSKVLYPSDETDAGRELRLSQQYFFVASTLTDIIRRYEKDHDDLDDLPDHVAIQLNDTHPSLAIAELMRTLVDERGLGWEHAWELTRATFAYTNHTLLPEALEVWPVEMMGRVLPRHLQIIFEINQRFLDGEVARAWPGDAGRRQRLSLIQEGPTKAVRMAHLAIVGSHCVNGVAALHTELIRSRLVPDFAELWPDKFRNITNGVTPRRWLRVCNPGLAEAISRRIGDDWVRDLRRLRQLEGHATDRTFQEELQRVKHENKSRLAGFVQGRLGIRLDPRAMFDVQVKRLHEYKRQLLNLLQVIIRYQRILDEPEGDWVPKVVIFGAKAAPAYVRAKLIIKLIHDVARTINQDRRIGDRLRVVFIPNYGVSLAEMIIPAADLSEQISTAGTEASGTGNMKFALNGALTIGTLDGANIEIRQAVGEEHFFLFGLTAEQVPQRRRDYNPGQIAQEHPTIRRALDAISQGVFNREAPGLFRPIVDSLTRDGDPYMLLADLEDYLDAQGRADSHWRQPEKWMQSVILNIARSTFFSSDRAVREYAEEIWNVSPITVPAEPAVAPQTQPGVVARSVK